MQAVSFPQRLKKGMSCENLCQHGTQIRLSQKTGSELAILWETDFFFLSQYQGKIFNTFLAEQVLWCNAAVMMSFANM